MGRSWAAVIALLGATACGLVPSRPAVLPSAALAEPQRYVIVAVADAPAPTAPPAGATERGYAAATHYGSSASSRRRLADLERDYGTRSEAGWPIAALHLSCVVMRVPSQDTADAFLARLARDPRVRLAEPLQSFHTLVSYDDPYANLQKNIPALGLERAHAIANGDGVRVAVVDTGVSAEHPDLTPAVVETFDLVGGDGRALREDLHGTEVAGVIAARAHNGIGIVGVAPRASLIALKACWQPDGEAHAVCNTFTLAKALARAVERGARIVNLSLTGPPDPLLAQLVAWGIGRGVIFVGAMPPDGGRDAFPVDVPGVIAADRAESSNRAVGVVYAPGDGILTLTPGGHYDFASGSSIAAAEVTGLLALVLQRRALPPGEVLSILTQSEMPAPPLASSVNACAALDAALGAACSRYPAAASR